MPIPSRKSLLSYSMLLSPSFPPLPLTGYFRIHVFLFLWPSVLMESDVYPTTLFSFHWGQRWPFRDYQIHNYSPTSSAWAPNMQWLVAVLHLDFKCTAQTEHIQNGNHNFPPNKLLPQHKITSYHFMSLSSSSHLIWNQALLFLPSSLTFLSPTFISITNILKFLIIFYEL